MAAAGRSVDELEMMGGTRGLFPDSCSVAPLDSALAAISEQVAAGSSTICVKPSQFIDDPSELPRFLAEVVAKVAALTA
jgi:hypothetical protein